MRLWLLIYVIDPVLSYPHFEKPIHYVQFKMPPYKRERGSAWTVMNWFSKIPIYGNAV